MAKAELDVAIHAAVLDARASGLTWKEIGAALNQATSSVHERYTAQTGMAPRYGAGHVEHFVDRADYYARARPEWAQSWNWTGDDSRPGGPFGEDVNERSLKNPEGTWVPTVATDYRDTTLADLTLTLVSTTPMKVVRVAKDVPTVAARRTMWTVAATASLEVAASWAVFWQAWSDEGQ